MLQVGAFSQFGTQAGDTVQQVPRGLDTLRGSFKQLAGISIGIEEEDGITADVAVQWGVVRHGYISFIR